MAVLTKYSETDELGGGRNKLELHLRPISYERNGYPRRITDVLANSGAQDLTIGTDELVQFRLRGKLSGNSPLVHFGAGQSHVRFTPLNTNNVDAVVKDNTITFPGAWNGADLRLSIGGHILRKEILLKTGHPRTFSFRIDDHQGLDLKSLQTADFRIHEPYLEGSQNQLIPLKWVQSVQGGKTVLTVTLPTGDYTGWTLDPTLTLQPDGTAGLDTMIYRSNVTYNFGVTTDLVSGYGGADYYRAMVKFDLSTVLGTVTSASYIATILGIGANASNETLSIKQALTQWYEGIRAGADNGAADGTTWAKRNGNTGAALEWGGSTGGGQSDTDWAAAAMGTTTYSAGQTGTKTISLDAATIESQRTGTNHGFWIFGNEAAVSRFFQSASAENTTAASRPKLSIEYSVPGSPHYYYQMLRRRN